MKIKKYFAKDMRQALNMAKEEQGPDVVILSNRKVIGGVELLAAEDYDEQEFLNDPTELIEGRELADAKPTTDIRSTKKANVFDRAFEQVQAETHVQAKSNSNNDLWTQDTVLERMQDEIHSLRKLLEQQMSGLAWGQIGRSHPVWAGLLRRFAQMGVSPVIAKSLVEQIPNNMDIEKAWRMSLAFFSYRIKTMNDDLLTPGNSIVFMGGSGVGKTTTVAKLATKVALEKNLDQLILATTDSYRVGGRDHLRSYGNILGLPVYNISNSVELKKLLDKYQTEKTILIDTAGLNPRDKNYVEQLDIITAESHRLKKCQVLSANAAPKSTIKLSNQGFPTELDMEFSILTKLDEADSIGRLLSFVVEKQLSVAYVSNGQRVPDDLQKAEAHKLISLAVSRFKQNPSMPVEEELEQIFGQHAVAEPFGE